MAHALDPEQRHELQAWLDDPLTLGHCLRVLAEAVPRVDWRVTVVDAGGVRTWTAVHEPGATFDPATLGAD